jgi:glycosyltransferase involved in cell wall biosynthesis
MLNRYRKVRTPTRRIAIVCQPWDNVGSVSNNSIVVIAYQTARRLPSDWHVTIYGRRGSGQKRWEIDDEIIEFKRLKIFHKPHVVLERLLGVLACYRRRRINYVLSVGYHLFYALRVALRIRASQSDVVLVHNFLQFAWIIKLFNPSATICLSMHCEWLTQFANTTNERRLRAIDLITGCSNYITDAIKSRFPAIAARCHTVYDGVDTDRFCPTSAVGEPNGGPSRLLYVGRITPEKGVHVLIQAFKILAETRRTLRLDLVGAAGTQRYLYLAPDPNDRAIASLEPFYGKRLSEIVWRQLILKDRGYPLDLAAEAGGDERIGFHDPVPQGETIDFYRRATVLVFPSVWNEPSGLPTFESQACGLPVVSTYSGGIPEYVEDGRTGILVPRGDAKELAAAISRVIDDPMLARAMGEAGRRRVLERFTWEASARHVADLIESVSGAQGSQGVLLDRDCA